MLKRILLAATVGAVMGTLVALELTPMFWWVGTIVGFLVGYMAYDPATVASATKTACLKAISWRPKEGWQTRLKMGTYSSIGLGGITGWGMLAFFGSILLSTMLIAPETQKITLYQACIFLSLVGGFGVVAGSLLFFFLLISSRGVIQPIATTAEQDLLDEIRKFALRWNPITTPFVALYYIIKYGGKALFWGSAGLVLVIICAPNAMRATGRSLRTFFVTSVHLIHSHARMVAGMSGATGTVVGYFTGSATLGGIAGFLTGLAAWGVTSFLVKHLPAPVRVS